MHRRHRLGRPDRPGHAERDGGVHRRHYDDDHGEQPRQPDGHRGHRDHPVHADGQWRHDLHLDVDRAPTRAHAGVHHRDDLRHADHGGHLLGDGDGDVGRRNRGSATFTITVNTAGGGCTSAGQKLGNPGFESGNTIWSASAGVIGQYASSGEPTHSGTWDAWLDGYGTTHTDTVSQSVTIPAGCTNSTLSFYLHIDTAETTTTTQFDKLTVTVGTTTVATYSNLNKAAGYTLRTFSVGSFAGQSVAVKFTGTEDSSLQTSFVVDDTALNAS